MNDKFVGGGREWSSHVENLRSDLAHTEGMCVLEAFSSQPGMALVAAGR